MPPRRRSVPKLVARFRVTLDRVKPRVWREFEIDAAGTFWDLHVAIQDAMGWQDSHLHLFEVLNPESEEVDRIGIPDPEGFDDSDTWPGWEVRFADYFRQPRDTASYTYDFGDDWEHEVTLVTLAPPESGVIYPRCLDGERACPPEDCGGPHGYKEFLAAISNPRHKEHAEYLEWAGGAFDPDGFDPAGVAFTDARRRLKVLLEEPG